MAESIAPTEVTAPYGEAERQAAEFAALRRMMKVAQGCFSLSVAVCNSPALRDYLIGQVRESSPELQVVSIPAGTIDVFGFAGREVRDSVRAALFVVNLEASVKSDQESQPTLRSLNASRELWPRKFSCPVVLWLPEYAATLLSTHARDFWRYRSHGFEFVSEQAGAIAGMADQFSGDLGAAADLSAEEKRFRIAELEQRIADAGESPPDALAHHIPVWLNELAFLYQFIGELHRAEDMLHKALQMDEKVASMEGMAADYGNLGIMYRKRGDLDRAEEMHRKALEIEGKLGRMEGMAADYGNLGLVYGTRGDLERAEEMHRKALEIHEKLGWMEGMAGDYGNLGGIYQARGDLDRAEQMHRKALEIEERLGRMEGMASDYGNLGLIYRARGDLDHAEQMHRKALEINEKLGRIEGVAGQYGNLGGIAAERGDIATARDLCTKALELFRRMGAAHQVQEVQRWLDALPEQEASSSE